MLTKNDVYQLPPKDSSLGCSLCSKLLRDAVKTPCCGTKFCDECIQTHLLEHDFTCPECNKRIADLDRLERDQETRDKVQEYIEEQIKKSEQESEAAAGNDGKAGDESAQQQQQDGSGEAGQNANQGPGQQAQFQQGSFAQFQEMLRQFHEMPPNPMATNMMIMQVSARLNDPNVTLSERQRLTGQLQYLQTLYMNQWQAMMTGTPLSSTGMTWGQQQAMQATNPFSHRAPNSDNDSPYMRTAINAKTRTETRQKRDRPADFFEVGGGGSKQARYYE